MLLTILMIAAVTAEGAASTEDADLASVNRILETLPGRKAVLFAELTEAGPKPLLSIDSDQRFAIGSSFKLFILGALIDEVNSGRRRMDDAMLLRANAIGPPHSELADWPLGAPTTLYTLALKMISISDNTATDHLLYLLGRNRVEQQLAAMGHEQPSWNRPFLFTREMVMIRDKTAPTRRVEYAKLDEAGKRTFLAREIAGQQDYEKLDFDTAAFDVAEWYATADDMARGLNWIRLNTGERQDAALLRQVLTLDAKLNYDAQTWTFVGFKGGSEDQLLAGNWLLRHRNGNWYAFHVFCNSPKEKVAPEKMVEAVQKVFDLVQQQLDTHWAQQP